MSEVTVDLVQYGWDRHFADAFEEHRGAGRAAGRIVLEQVTYSAVTEQGELEAVVAGRLKHRARGPHDLPAIGDWVALSRPAGSDTLARIEAVLPRKTRISRKVAGSRTAEQMVAANVDTLFIVMGLDRDYNLRRLERFLTMARDSGARPVILLNKLDLTENLEPCLEQVEAVALGAAPVHALSAKLDQGLEVLAPYLVPGQTVALVGSSGVGKSTLINRLASAELMPTGEVSEHDGRGRHTTSHRQLLRLSSGALLIDNPGIRELQLWDGDLEGSFDDVTRLGQECRFRDCRHEAEPGCAVRAAIEDGRLALERFASYRRLQAELAHLERRQDQSAQLVEKRRWRAIHRSLRKHKPRG